MSLGEDASTESLLYPHADSNVEFVRLCAEPTPLSPPAPLFLTPPSFFRFSWRELLRSLFDSYADLIKGFRPDLFRDIPLLPRRFAAKPLSASLVFHLIAIPLLPFFLHIVPRPVHDEGAQLSRQDVIYYHFAKTSERPHLPKLSPTGPGGKPGSGNAPEQPPKKGSSSSLASLTMVSRPRIPDNDHQTILQSASPADLKIQADIALPNLVVGRAVAPKPRLEFRVNDVRPVQPSASSKLSTDAPTLTKVVVDSGVNGILGVPTSQPHLPVPVGGASAAPRVTQRSANAGGDDTPIIPTDSGGSGGAGLVVLGTNPAPSSQVVGLPPGNRYGQFVVAPGEGGQGSPGGGEVGHAGGGTGGIGGGGDGSNGIGNGASGGGGGSEGTNGFVSLSGSGGPSSTMLADPGPAAAAQLVYAIPESMLLRHNKLVVSAGPIGGGGSGVYGVLPCGRIYTVFLATGQKQWSLQYCQKSEARESSQNQARLAVVHTELPILPPEAVVRYNFKRFPLPPEKASKSILLRGVLTEEGKVENVEIYQGLLPAMDEAARSAFKQWKFKPAMRSGKPTRVEVLLSIPMESL